MDAHFEDNFLVKVETKFNQEVQKEVSMQSLNKLKPVFIFLIFFMSLLGIVVCKSENDISDIIPFIAVDLFLIFMLIFIPIIAKKSNASMSLLNDNTQMDIGFDDYFIYIHQKQGDSFEALEKMSYNHIFQVNETQKAFILYISNSQAHVVFKKDIVLGNEQLLRKILITKLGSKFKGGKNHEVSDY